MSDQKNEPDIPDGGWRYQPVYVDSKAGRTVTLCECHFGHNGGLMSWTEDPAMEPQGDTIEELRADLIRMLVDAWKWQPVPFSSLRVGMTFHHTGAHVENIHAAIEALAARNKEPR